MDITKSHFVSWDALLGLSCSPPHLLLFVGRLEFSFVFNNSSFPEVCRQGRDFPFKVKTGLPVSSVHEGVSWFLAMIQVFLDFG